MELFRLSNTDRKVKYPPTAVTIRISYSVTHASRTSKAMSRESRTMNTNQAATNDNTIMGFGRFFVVQWNVPRVFE